MNKTMAITNMHTTYKQHVHHEDENDREGKHTLKLHAQTLPYCASESNYIILHNYTRKKNNGVIKLQKSAMVP